MPPPLPPLRPSATLLIGLTCLGSGVALAAGRQLLLRLAPPLNPTTPQAALAAARYRSLDPQRRRDAALLLSAQPGRTTQERRRLLQGQGWGRSVLAAVALKQSAQAAAASGHPREAQALWRSLLRRFPDQPASADALYALGAEEPRRREELLRRFPAHPAALAAALERGDSLHLARWGARWPGAEPLLVARCEEPNTALSPQEREQLATALLQLGQRTVAQRCLGDAPLPDALQLKLGRSLLRGSAEEQNRGQLLLLNLARQRSDGPTGQEAAALLAEEPGNGIVPLLRELPAPLQASPAVQARLALEGVIPWQPVLQRWPAEPSSWELQWQLARRALLQRQWQQAASVLSQINSAWLPAPLAARQLFWQGYAAQELNRPEQAERFWNRLLQVQPAGYYSWRALVRLGRDQTVPEAAPASAEPGPELPWQPLGSGDAQIEELWRTGQTLEAWESWRSRNGGRPPEGARQLLLEGRLRTGIGDDWTGLGQLEFANLRLPQGSCREQWRREQQQHPRRFQRELTEAALAEGVDRELLWGVARQESRFSPAVASPVGAVGLLQLMPETAAELAGSPQSRTALENAGLNARLGARYLNRLRQRWQNQPFLMVASYNAGPGAVASWLGPERPDPQREPELWTEAIPYPETRLYVKKVLGNRWSYRLLSGSPDRLCSAR